VGANTNVPAAVAITVPVSQELSVATGFTLTVAGAFVTTGAGTVATTDTGKIALAHATPATNAANLKWAAENSGTTLALVLGASAEIADGTTVTLDEDVTLAVPATNSPVLTVKGTLDATASSVVVGDTSGNAVTLGKAHITGDNSTGVILTGAEGTADFAATDVLILAEDGTIATLGDGTATFGATEFSGVGTWTASGSGSESGSDTINGVEITSADTGATIAVSAANSDGWDEAILTASGASPVITQDKGAANNLVIDTGAVIALVANSSLVLNATNDAGEGAKFTGAGKVTAGPTEIVGGSGGWSAVHASAANGTVTIAGGANGATITGGENVTFTAGANAVITQLAEASNNLTIAADTTINLGGSNAKVGEIVLTGGDAPGQLTLTASSSKIITGNTVTSYNTAKPLATTGTDSTATDTDFDTIGVANVKGDGAQAQAKTSAGTPADDTASAGLLVELSGGTNGTVTGGDTGDDGLISGQTATAATSAS
jgi:hypothetical protein